MTNLMGQKRKLDTCPKCHTGKALLMIENGNSQCPKCGTKFDGKTKEVID